MENLVDLGILQCLEDQDTNDNHRIIKLVYRSCKELPDFTTTMSLFLVSFLFLRYRGIIFSMCKHFKSNLVSAIYNVGAPITDVPRWSNIQYDFFIFKKLENADIATQHCIKGGAQK
eukprot:SAG11_NODE_336_length_10544_cov_9.794926_8_plen_117_part_00